MSNLRLNSDSYYQNTENAKNINSIKPGSDNVNKSSTTKLIEFVKRIFKGFGSSSTGSPLKGPQSNNQPIQVPPRPRTIPPNIQKFLESWNRKTKAHLPPNALQVI